MSSILPRGHRGASVVEYFIAVGVVALLALIGFVHFGQSARGLAERETECVRTFQCGQGSPYAAAGPSTGGGPNTGGAPDGVPPSTAQATSGGPAPGHADRFWEGTEGKPVVASAVASPPEKPGFFEELWGGFTGAEKESSAAAVIGDLGGAFIPFYGNGRDAARAWEGGEYGWAVVYGLGVTGDAFGGSIIKGGLKAGAKAVLWTGRLLGLVADSKVLYRGAGRAPSEIFAEGFKARGVDGMGRPPPTGTLEERVRWDAQYPTGEFVNVSSNAEVAETFATHRDGWVYKIETRREGVDTNKVLGGRSPYPKELEFKYDEIKPSEIVGATNLKTGEWRPNPNFEPQ